MKPTATQRAALEALADGARLFEARNRRGGQSGFLALANGERVVVRSDTFDALLRAGWIAHANPYGRRGWWELSQAGREALRDRRSSSEGAAGSL